MPQLTLGQLVQFEICAANLFSYGGGHPGKLALGVGLGLYQALLDI